MFKAKINTDLFLLGQSISGETRSVDLLETVDNNIIVDSLTGYGNTILKRVIKDTKENA